jgi:hypothetical protein
MIRQQERVTALCEQLKMACLAAEMADAGAAGCADESELRRLPGEAAGLQAGGARAA